MTAEALDPREFTMTSAEAAAELGVSPGRVRQLLMPEETAVLPSLKRGNTRLLRPGDVVRLKARPKHRWDRSSARAAGTPTAPDDSEAVSS